MDKKFWKALKCQTKILRKKWKEDRKEKIAVSLKKDPGVSEDKIAGNQKGVFKWSEANRPAPPQQSSAVHTRQKQE